MDRIFFTIVLVMLAWMSLEDMRSQQVPDRMIRAASAWALAGFLTQKAAGCRIWPVSLYEGICSVTAVLAAAVVLSIVLSRLIGTVPFGGADLKLLGIGALALGWARTTVAFAIAVAAAGCWILAVTVTACAHRGFRRPAAAGESALSMKSGLAFVPFLSMGLTAALWCGDEIIRWYVH